MPAVVVLGICLFTGYGHPWPVLALILRWRSAQGYLPSPLVMARGIDIHPGP